MTPPHTFAGNPLDRGDVERRDAAWLESRAENPSSRFLPLWRLEVPVTSAAGTALAWLSATELKRLNLDTKPIFLGLRDRVAHFAVDVSATDDPLARLGRDGAIEYAEARQAAALLSADEAGILAQARAQIDWHARHGFCSVCGQATEPARGGQQRACSACGAQHFPRTDPVVIVVVTDGDRCLLGQSHGRLARAGRYSALAGFMDQAETIEEAVRREVREEAGIEVGEVRYHSSQPWPFPSSLMIGCHGTALTTEIRRDDEEMIDVRWFARDAVRLALEERNPDLALPGPIAIAHHLIKAWAAGEA